MGTIVPLKGSGVRASVWMDMALFNDLGDHLKGSEQIRITAGWWIVCTLRTERTLDYP